MSSVKTVYDVITYPLTKGKKSFEEKQTVSVIGIGQKAAYAIDKKFKGVLFRKILKGFLFISSDKQEKFIPLELQSKLFK